MDDGRIELGPERAASETVPGFDHGDRITLSREVSRGDESTVARTDYHNVDGRFVSPLLYVIAR